MVIEKPNISPTARLTITQAAKILEVCTNSVRKYIAKLHIKMQRRAIGGWFLTGLQVIFIWERVTQYGI